MSDKPIKSDAEWRAQLTPLQYNVTRRRGTERAFSGEHLDRGDEGIYRCVCCGAELFDSHAKLDAGAGMPCFRAPVDSQRLRTQEDYSWFRRRIAVSCAACDAHLGHVFDDDPGGATRRYRVNSVALRFEKQGPGARVRQTPPD